MNRDRFTVEPGVSNHFAWLRTRLGIERTFMAWVRTAISLIGFGFTIVQFFQHLPQMQGAAARPMRPEAPRDLGLALIGSGILSLAVAIWQYRQQLNYLWHDQFRAIAGFDEKPHRTPLFLAGIVLLLIGLFAFISVLFRLN